jgi:hypothetical protein
VNIASHETLIVLPDFAIADRKLLIVQVKLTIAIRDNAK